MPPDPETHAEETLDPEDGKSMRALGHRIPDDAMDYLETLRDRPTIFLTPPDEEMQPGSSLFIPR